MRFLMALWIRPSLPPGLDAGRIAGRAIEAYRTEGGGGRDPKERAIFGASALLLGLHRGLCAEGLPSVEASLVCREVAWRVWRRWLSVASLWTPSTPEAVAAAFRDQLGPPHFTIEPVGDRGLDVLRCPFAAWFAAREETVLCEHIVCALDARAADARGLALTRTQTLAGGHPRCDFRWSEGDSKRLLP